MATKVGENIQIAFDCSLLKQMAKNKLDSCLIMYDDIADELILKFLEPKHQTSYFYIDDNSALIIDDFENSVVGLSLLNFKEVHFSDLNFKDVWDEAFEKSITRNYVTITNPTKEIGPENKTVLSNHRFAKNEREVQKFYNGIFTKIIQSGSTNHIVCVN
jgi:hypothetical protein